MLLYVELSSIVHQLTTILLCYISLTVELTYEKSMLIFESFGCEAPANSLR